LCIALKGQDTIPQGAALGYGPNKYRLALKERDPDSTNNSALSGLGNTMVHLAQGFALGYHIVPFQGDWK
jgi:hypothetical protein